MYKRLNLQQLVPPHAVAVSLQYFDLPDGVFVSATSDQPGMALEPPSGIVEIVLSEPQAIYLLAPPGAIIDISVTGYRI